MELQRLAEVLKVIAEENWTESTQPMLLSALPRLLRERLQDDYKTALEGESLKAFIKRTGSEQSGYRLVEHPTQKAKLGLLPWGTPFEFEANSVPQTISASDVQALARVLSALSEEERKGIVFSGSVVAKLLTAK